MWHSDNYRNFLFGLIRFACKNYAFSTHTKANPGNMASASRSTWYYFKTPLKKPGQDTPPSAEKKVIFSVLLLGEKKKSPWSMLLLSISLVSRRHNPRRAYSPCYQFSQLPTITIDLSPPKAINDRSGRLFRSCPSFFFFSLLLFCSSFPLLRRPSHGPIWVPPKEKMPWFITKIEKGRSNCSAGWRLR